jgi:hypothetical protein
MKKWLPEFLMLFGSVVLILGFFMAPGNPVTMVGGFGLIAAGFVGRRLR